MIKQFGFLKISFNDKFFELKKVGLIKDEQIDLKVFFSRLMIDLDIEIKDYDQLYHFISKKVSFDIRRALTKESCQIYIGDIKQNGLIDTLYDCLFIKESCYGSLIERAIEKGFLYQYGFKNNSTLVLNGKMMPVFSGADYIMETVYVKTNLDTDYDFKADRIAVFIKRPATSIQLPAFYISNPYCRGTNDEMYFTHDVDVELEIKNNSNTDLKYSNPKSINDFSQTKYVGKADSYYPELLITYPLMDYLIPRGFASVYCGGIGTRGSNGMRSCGGVDETLSTIAVIDWLCGNQKAFTSLTSDVEVIADWCNGNVGMGGKSYLGTLAIAAGSKAPLGLKTIIPEAAICNWYDYYRCNGLVSPALGWQGDDADLLAENCMSRMMDGEDNIKIEDSFREHKKKLVSAEDRCSANYNAFWHERNYLKDIEPSHYSVLSVHGLNDYNVKTGHVFNYLKALEKNKIKYSAILHQGDHIYINNLYSLDFNDIINTWLTQELYDVNSEYNLGVIVQDNIEINKWKQLSNITSEKFKTFTFTNVDSFIDNKELSCFISEKENDDEWLDELVLSDTLGNKVKYEINTIDTICGSPKIKVSLAINKPTAIISAMLVEVGEEYRLDFNKTDNNHEIINAFNDTKEVIENFSISEHKTKYKVISRGHLNLQNRDSIINNNEVIINGVAHYTFSLQPTYFKVNPNAKLYLIVYGSDMQLTIRPSIITQYNIDRCELLLPVEN